jgi:biopolymer transport protein ExbB
MSPERQAWTSMRSGKIMRKQASQWLVLLGLAVLLAAWVGPVVSGELAAPANAGASAAPTVTKGPTPLKISLWTMMKAGGWVGLLIVLESVVAGALIVEHFISIRRGRLIPAALVHAVEQHLAGQHYDQARQTCLRDGSFIGLVVAAGLNQIGSMFGFFDMQSAMQEVSEREIAKLYRKLEYLSFIAATAPMLGLLGTVTGMITAFNEVAASEGAAKPAQLAGGIWEALVTTAEGLVVAIPVMFFVSVFRNRIDGYVAEAESVVERLMGQFRRAGGQ